MKRILGVLATISIGSGALADQPAFDPRDHRTIAGAPTEVLVLGTPHLSELPASFTPDSLAPVLDRLAAWKPTIITIEGLSGPQCEFLERYKAIYEDTFDSYCWDLGDARKATGLDVVAATVEARRLLDGWPAAPSPAQRRHLAAVFAAAGDRASALVQWLRLPTSERHAGDGVDAPMAAMLTAAPAKRNENYAIAAALAARLGLERVYPVDDHTADETAIALGKPYEDALKDIWRAADDRHAADKARNDRLGTPDATLQLYRYHNQPETMDSAFASDFGAALRHEDPALYGRQYVGWWETRNLRMVANIRAAAAPHPGARVLAVVGSSHKGYFEAYLGMMHDMRIDDTEAVLR